MRNRNFCLILKVQRISACSANFRIDVSRLNALSFPHSENLLSWDGAFQKKWACRMGSISQNVPHPATAQKVWLGAFTLLVGTRLH